MATHSKSTQEHCDVLIIGAGPTGLTLACDLARRGVRIKIIEKSATPFQGSRGKGIQPRTIEVFDDLGVADRLLRAGSAYPPMAGHVSFLKLTWAMMKRQRPTPDVPYPNVWLVPQWRTEEVLRNRLAEWGHQVEWATVATEINQDAEGVQVQTQCQGESRTFHARYVVGADGGKSFVRKYLNLDFAGATSQEGRMIVADLQADGLSRDRWHVWPSLKGGMIGLCPLPHSNLFQLMMRLSPGEPDPDLSEQAIQSRWLAATGSKKIRLHSPTWVSVFRPNVRLVERYRVGRIFLAGDAAHVHTPAGAQGLNTGVQDAYNLGWKLALALKGASDALLDTYEEERRPVAAAVLELSTTLFQGTIGRAIPKLKRGDKERQLLLNYRESSLSQQPAHFAGSLRAGDRAPNAICSHGRSGNTELFDVFRGGHFTLLAFGPRAIEAVRNREGTDPQHLQIFAIYPSHGEQSAGDLIDENGSARQVYGVGDDDNVTFLVRPDGYVGHIANEGWEQGIEGYLNR